MPHRGSKTNDRGRGFRGSPRGGRGRGRGGRGFRGGLGPMGGGRGRGQGIGFIDDMDFVVQVWPDEGNGLSRRGNSRGRGMQSPHPRNNVGNSDRGNTTPRGRGTPRGRARGYGRGSYQTDSSYTPRRGKGPRSNVPLSRLLERPLLRPITFVPSVYTKVLFEEKEDLLQSVPENADPIGQNDVPTADRVARVFSGNFPSQQDPSSDNESDHDENEGRLEEINFEDMQKIRDEVEATASAIADPSDMISIEERFTGFYVDPKTGISPPRRTENNYHVDAREAQGEVDEDSINEIGDYQILFPSHAVETSITIEESHASIKEDQEHKITTETQSEVNQLGGRRTSGFSSQTIVAISGDNMSSVVNLQARDTVDRDENGTPLFFIDTERSYMDTSNRESITGDRVFSGAPLGEPDEEIVYVAPHPRSGKIATVPSEPVLPLSSTSILTGTTNTATHESSAMDGQFSTTSIREQSGEPAFSSVSFSFASPSPKKQPHHRPIFSEDGRSKAKAKARKKEARVARRRMERQAMFGSFGAILSEERLRDEDWKGKGKDPKWEQRRRGDSDIDWGDGDDDEDANEEMADAVDEISSGLGGMDIDPDIGMDIPAMKGFIHSMSSHGGMHTTMDDIADEERMRQEDEEEQESDSHGSESDTEDDGDISDSEEQEMVFAVEEEIMIAEADGEDFQEDVKSQDEVSEEDNSSDDDDQSPKSGFQARLKRLHDKARVRKTADYNPESEVESSDEDPPWTRADGDNRYIAHIEAMLEENSHIINGHDRKERKALFRAIEEGTLDDFYETDDGFHTTPSKRNKQKKKSIPIELQSQWEKDRLKKAEYKRMRNEARLLAAMDPLTPKKGGKKGRKASLAAALLDDAMPNKVVDLVSLDRQIRRFIADLGGRQEMVLPPMDKSSRKVVHELANAFNLKSMSKGRGKHRYTTLIKTTRTGINVREGKIRGILRRTGGGRFDRPDDRGSGKGKGTDRAQAPRHRDGDEVGKAAPKIGENNIGFKMLASMGWSEGERIGVSSFGLHAPLTAVIKNTKSGLGATR